MGDGMTTDRALRPREVAERWQCSERHVRNLLCGHRLKFFRLGAKLIRIPLEAVEEYERCNLSSDSLDGAASSPSNGTTKQAADSAARLARISVVKRNGA
jgi:excisionase family DNA binding protein